MFSVLVVKYDQENMPAMLPSLIQCFLCKLVHLIRINNDVLLSVKCTLCGLRAFADRTGNMLSC